MPILLFRLKQNSVLSKFDNIQYMRALAACLVVVDHTTNSPSLGSIGVALFFVISGFIMITTSWDRFQLSGAPGNFVLRRLARIMIPWWICLSVKLIMDSRERTPLWIMSSYLLLPIPNPSGIIDPIHGIGWSLVWEMIFYYLFSISLFFERKIAIVSNIIVFSLISVAGYLYSDFQTINWHGEFIFILFGGGLVIGALRKYYSISSGMVVLILMFSIFLIILGCTPQGVAYFHKSIDLAAILAVGAMVFMKNMPPNNRIARAVHSVGDASFALYITHTIVMRLVIVVLRNLHIPSDLYYLVVPVQIIFSIIVAMLFYKYVESPLNAFTHAYLKRAATPSQSRSVVGVSERGGWS